jgi:hypothetical protein
VATLFRSLDVDCSGTINEPEFRKALVLLGHGDVPAEEIHDVFASLDTDGSGCVEYRELYLALGKPLPPALKARLHPPKTTLDATRARWGQGAFKPSSGSLGNNMRTLFGLRATDNDISASLRKLDDLFPGAEAAIEQSIGLEASERRLVVRHMLGLTSDRGLPAKAQPGQVFADRRLERGPTSRRVNILDAEHQPPADLSGDSFVAQGRISMTEMKISVR